MEIPEDNLEKFMQYFAEPPHPSYIAAFIDGDGSISITRCNDGFNPRITISQCRTNILSILMHHFGGFVKFCHPETETRRALYFYVNRGETLHFLANYIKDHILIKSEQINALVDFLPFLNKTKCIEEKNRLCDIAMNANKNKPIMSITSEQINDFYLAGFFDAEGCIQIGCKDGKYSKSITIKITQRNNPNILVAFRDYLGYGKIETDIWIIYGNNDGIIHNFVSRIIDKTIVKHNQLKAVLQYLETMNDVKLFGLIEEINDEREELALSISDEKHLSETCEADIGSRVQFDYPHFGSGLFERQEQERKLEIEEKLRKKEEERKLKSIKMTGEGNPNFNKELPQEHCDKISRATFGKHRAISDETIHQILLLKDSLSQIKICEKLHVERHHVSDVISGKLLPTDSATLVEDLAKLKEKKTQQSLLKEKLEEKGIIVNSGVAGGISKRSIDGKYMANIWYFGKLRVDRKTNLVPLPFTNSASKVAEYVSKKLTIEVTENMVKNIWNKKTKIYEIDINSDFPFTFKNYLDDIIENPKYFNIFEST